MPNASEPNLCVVLAASRQFLKEALERTGATDADGILDAYAQPDPAGDSVGFFERLVHHSYNKQMGPRVVGRAVNSKASELRALLSNYNPEDTVRKWRGDATAIFDALLQGGFVTAERAGLYWRNFARSISDAAIFVSSIENFEEFATAARRDELSSLGAIALVEASIRGYGPALAADVLKEAEIINSVKPDTHTKKMADLLGISWTSDLDLLMKLNRGCVRNGCSPYTFDKFVWLIFSRRFYKHEHLSPMIDLAEFFARIQALKLRG